MQVFLSPLAEFKIQNSFSQTEEFPGVYKCVVNRHNSLFYRIKADKDEVEVITVIDNRQNPQKVREELTKHFE